MRIFIYLFIYLALPTRAGSPQQHMPITVGPFYLTHPVNFPCGRKPEYPGKTHDFRQSVDFLLFSHEDWVRVALRKYLVRFEPAASEVKGKCANHLATEAPQYDTTFLTVFILTHPANFALREETGAKYKIQLP
jgi:hypothetical protein